MRINTVEAYGKETNLFVVLPYTACPAIGGGIIPRQSVHAELLVATDLRSL